MKQFTYVSPSTLKFDAYVSKRREEEREREKKKRQEEGGSLRRIREEEEFKREIINRLADSIPVPSPKSRPKEVIKEPWNEKK
jgi:hypothetical protein